MSRKRNRDMLNQYYDRKMESEHEDPQNKKKIKKLILNPDQNILNRFDNLNNQIPTAQSNSINNLHLLNQFNDLNNAIQKIILIEKTNQQDLFDLKNQFKEFVELMGKFIIEFKDNLKKIQTDQSNKNQWMDFYIN
jgi:hypothetical protein